MNSPLSKLLLSALVLLVCAVTTASAQTGGKSSDVAAQALYQAFRSGKAGAYEDKTLNISGTATRVGPDPYALPSVELAEEKGKPSRVLCVLPFADYLKLRKVKKGDRVVIRGQARGYSKEHGYVVVKECKILIVNGKRQ